MAMRSIALALLSLFLTGCQINPYTFQPDWTSPSWFDAGKEDAMNGLPVKDNQTLADSFNDPHVDRSEYLRGYADGQKKVCEEGFIHAWGLAGKSFLPVAILPKMRQNCVRHGKKGWMKVCAPADLINLFLSTGK
jgi:hypothetical protein